MGGISRNELKEFSALFGGLSGDELKQVANIVNHKEYEAGVVIIAEGETGSELYLLADGVVDVSRTLTIVTAKHEFGTKERSFSRLSGADRVSFGELGLIGRGERTATVKAVTKCSLFTLSSEDFLTLAKSNPNIGYVVVSNIASMLAAYLRKTNDDVIKLTTALSLALSG